MRRQEEHVRHKVVAWRVTMAKLLQCQVWVAEVYRSRWDRERDVSPSLLPAYMRLIQKQITQIRDFRTGAHHVTNSTEKGNAGPCGACMSWGESCV